MELWLAWPIIPSISCTIIRCKATSINQASRQQRNTPRVHYSTNILHSFITTRLQPLILICRLKNIPPRLVRLTQPNARCLDVWFSTPGPYINPYNETTPPNVSSQKKAFVHLFCIHSTSSTGKKIVKVDTRKSIHYPRSSKLIDSVFSPVHTHIKSPSIRFGL